MPATKVGGSFEIAGSIKARLFARGASERMRMTARGDLKFDKLELTITNPGNEAASSSPVPR